MRTGIAIILFLTGSLILSSCRPPRDLEFRSIQNVSFENAGFNNIRLGAELIYYNPNNFGLELNRADLDIFLDSTLLGHSGQEFQVAIPKRDIFTLPVKVDLDTKNLLKNGFNAIFKKEVTIRAVGSIKLGKAGIFKSFPIDYTTRQQIALF